MLVAKALPPAKTMILIGVLLVALLGIFYLMYNYFLKDFLKSENITTSTEVIGSDFNLPQEKLFNDKFFEQEEVKGLQNFGPLPLTVQTITKTDPFAPLITPTVNTNNTNIINP